MLALSRRSRRVDMALLVGGSAARRSAGLGALLRDQVIDDAQDVVEALAADHAILAGHDHRRGRFDAAALDELRGALELGVDGEARHGARELLRVDAMLAVELADLFVDRKST